MEAERMARMIAVDAWFEARQAKPLALEFYMVALAGELGEAAELIEKLQQGPGVLTAGAFLDAFALELADCEIYLQHMARKADIALTPWKAHEIRPGDYVGNVFIEVANRVGAAANLLKKRMRGDDLPAFQADFQGMVAMCEVYLRRLARTAGIDLDEAVDRKLTICEERWGIPRR